MLVLKACCPGLTTPEEVLEVHVTGGSDVFFWVENLHARYFLASRDLSRIFLGLKKIRLYFGFYLRANFSSRVFVAISGSEKFSFELFFSDVCSEKTVNIVARYFGGSKISGVRLCIFWVCNMKLRRTPPPPPCVFFGFAI